MGFSSTFIGFLPDEVILMSRECNLILRANATLSNLRFPELRQGYKYTWLELTCREFGLSALAFTIYNILNKSEKATPELFDIYIQNYANQECK